MALSNPPKKIIRFIFAGTIVTLIYIVTGLLLLNIFEVTPVIANGLAFIIANIFSYVIHTLWSFSAEIKKNNFFKFYLVSLCGFLISLALPAMSENFNINKSFTVIITSLAIPLFTFLLHHLWTYK
jgi:putative flippase GtrA